MPPTSNSRRQRKRGGPPAYTPVPPSPSYYFYQSSLGANVFLHPLDIRILLAHFKSYESFPPSISFRSSGFDPGTINDELRKRYKYLSHLPAGTEVVFVEAELEEIVGATGLAAFEQPLKARKAKRRDRVKKEDRAKSRWEKAEREKMPTSTPAEDREFALALARSTVETNWANEPTPSLGASVGSSTGIAEGFAAAAGGGNGTGSPGTSPSGVWGTRPSFATALHSHTVASARPGRTRGTGAGGVGEEEDAELEAAWEAFSLGEVGTVRETEKGGGGGGKKGGKKGRGKTLVLSGGMGGRRA